MVLGLLPESRIPRLGTINYKIGKLLDSVVTVELGCSNSRKEVGSGTYYRSSRVPD